MLVLSRKVGEGVVIEGGIEVRILEVRAGRIRLGIEAPPEVRVLRTELGEIPAAAGALTGDREAQA
jgi:carbon storage regulator